MAIYVIGACNIDISARSDHRLIERDSNPATVRISVGGVGHNIAQNMTNLTEDIYFVSVFGDDHFGHLAYKTCLAEGLDLTFSKIKGNSKQSMYLAILDETGDMYLAVNDMDIIEGMTKKDLNEIKEVITDKDMLCVDNNLSEEIISYIANDFKGIKFSDAISVAKAFKLNAILDKLDILKVNIYEAEALSGISIKNEEDIMNALSDLLDKGVKKVLLTYRDGVYLAKDGHIYRYLHNATKVHIQNATGAGDALLGAYIAAVDQGKDDEEAIKDGLVASLITIEDERTVSDLDRKMIADSLYRKKIKGELVL